MRVLVVHEDAATRVLLREVLEDAGYVVLSVRNGQAALAVLDRAQWPVVVLLDHRLVGGSGWDVAGAARATDRAYILLAVAPHETDGRSLVLVRPLALGDLLTAVAKAAARLDGR